MEPTEKIDFDQSSDEDSTGVGTVIASVINNQENDLNASDVFMASLDSSSFEIFKKVPLEDLGTLELEQLL